VSARVRAAILISGRGSNMSALIEAARAPDFPAEIALVVSNRSEAGGLAVAKRAGVAAAAIDPKIYAGRDEFEASIQAMLDIHRIQLICLAGYMRVLGAPFVNRWRGRMINIHPSLLPAYRGLHTHERALADGVTEHGCTVHFVEPELDAGPIIAQARVPVLPGDTPETLAARVLVEEHRIYPLALAKIAREIAGRRDSSSSPTPS
jgi:phosphoribosylglycinamide formyltransferase 1